MKTRPTRRASRFSAPPEIAGIYVSTANSLATLRAIADRGLARRMSVVTTDVFPGLVPFLESGVVAATIDQRRGSKGDGPPAAPPFLAEGSAAGGVRLPPQIVVRSNLREIVRGPRADACDARAGRQAKTAKNARTARITIPQRSRRRATGGDRRPVSPGAPSASQWPEVRDDRHDDHDAANVASIRWR